MSKNKNFFFNKEDKAVKEFLKNEKMNLIFGGLAEEYERVTTYTESTSTGNHEIKDTIKK